MQVQDCMTKDVDVISPETTLFEAACMMRDNDYGALLVGENDRLKGMVTDRDITVCGVARGLDPQSTQVADVMSNEVIYCFEDDSIEDVAAKMSSRQIRRLPILNRNMRLTGVISLGDISQAQTQNAGGALAEISEQTHREPANH